MPRKYSKNVEKLIQKIKYQCSLLDVEFSLSKSYSVYTKDGYSCLGFFIAPSRLKRGMLRVGTGSKPIEEWVLTLAHEYAHMLQWFNNNDLYYEYEDDDSLYYKLEVQTEREALKILRESGIRVTDSLKSRSRKYIKKVREDSKKKRKHSVY